MFTRGLYAVLDPDLVGSFEILDLAERVLSAGCSLLQLRAKTLSDRARVDLACALKERCLKHSVPFVLNDRVDLARIVDADGVHLGQDDLPLRDARALAGNMWIGVSTHSVAQALAAERDGANMIGFGPVFPTTSKERPDPVVGIERLREVVRAVRIPVAAIGGVTTMNASDLARTGVALAAVISALSHTDAPELAARTIHNALRSQA